MNIGAVLNWDFFHIDENRAFLSVKHFQMVYHCFSCLYSTVNIPLILGGWTSISLSGASDASRPLVQSKEAYLLLWHVHPSSSVVNRSHPLWLQRRTDWHILCLLQRRYILKELHSFLNNLQEIFPQFNDQGKI